MRAAPGRKTLILSAVAAVVALLAAVGVVALVRALHSPAAPGELAVQRYGFADDGGAPWAPESGQLQITDRAGFHKVAIGLRFRTQGAIDQLDGHALEFRLAVRAPTPCRGGWASGARDAGVRGLPRDAHAYVTVTAGATCADTLIRIGSVAPTELEVGHEYTLTATVPAGTAKAEVATLDVARRTASKCDDRPSCVTGTVAFTGPDVESLVGAGWGFDGTGCRRWFADANTSFPCLPDDGARIMTLGDSITAGAIGDHTWRYWAWQKLRKAGDPVWTGMKTETWTGDYAVPHQKWGSRHDAVAGISASTVVPEVPALVRAEHPDILFIDLGTNDVHPLHGSTAAQAAQALDQIVRFAQAVDPTVQIMLGQPAGHHDVPLSVMADLATRIADIAAARTTSDSLVTAVDLRTGWDRPIDTWDGTHPTEAGEFFLASRFIDRLASADAYGRQFGALPQPSIPMTPPQVHAAVQNGSILVAWQRVPQASEYRVYLRDTTAGGDFLMVGAGSRDLAWGKSGLIPGHAYEYYVTSMSSGLESRPSPIGKITAA